MDHFLEHVKKDNCKRTKVFSCYVPGMHLLNTWQSILLLLLNLKSVIITFILITVKQFASGANTLALLHLVVCTLQYHVQ